MKIYEAYDPLLRKLFNSHLLGWMLVWWGARLAESKTFVSGHGVFTDERYIYAGYILALSGAVFAYIYRINLKCFFLNILVYGAGYTISFNLSGFASILPLGLIFLFLSLWGWKQVEKDTP
jgi:hypothetical protein